MLDQHQIERRRPLWIALSELWLDTELFSADLERIARVMADSGLTIEALREVYLFEVAPVVSRNLLTTAGEWAGFDEEWLCSRIVSNLRDRPRLTRFWSWFPLTRRAMTYASEEHWRRLIELVGEYRALG
ncbi:MAG TPA: hypothetical protein VFC14_09860 [Burkholderiales bacterium]|nr:hypothetical protein [Burkholderiales bacterium]